MWSSIYLVALLVSSAVADCEMEEKIKQLIYVLTEGPQRHFLSTTSESSVLPFLDCPNKSTFDSLKVTVEKNIKKIESENIKLFESGIDTMDNVTAGFGPHLITHDDSLEMDKEATMFVDITQGAVKSAMSTVHDLTTTIPSTNVTRNKAGDFIFSNVADRRHIDQFIARISTNILDLPCKFKKHVKCDATYKYRTINGLCNNLGHPRWGMSFTPFDRFLQPDYDDNVNSPRTLGLFALNLDSARLISNKVHTLSNDGDLDMPLSYFSMQFGQFLDHDITKTALSKGYAGSNLQCCSQPRQSSLINDECFPIAIPTDDKYFDNKLCMNFVRSTAATSLDCTHGHREQLNELTHFIDGSGVYGSTQSKLDELYDNVEDNGKLKVSDKNRLPLDEQNDSECHINSTTELCFKAGDVRANVQPGLSSLHTIFMREHNRIAQHFIDHFNWDGKKVFEETRRYIAAEIQHITYNEFLPKLINETILELFGLVPLSTGYFTGYDPYVRPMIRNAFAAAAYRMGHSLLRKTFFFSGLDSDLHTQFNRPHLIYKEWGIEKCTRGLYQNPAQSIDEKMTREVTWKLFEEMAKDGGDLAAFNIQRGRDHGLPSYATWLHYCTCITIEYNNFEPGVHGGLKFHSPKAAAQLKSAYRYTHDIDLFPGAMTETPLPGGRLGPTFTCILALQFRALKYGDRFYYEGNTNLNPHPFTPWELEGFRPITMAKIICENTEINSIPVNVFMKEDPDNNPAIPCSDIPDICFPVHGGWSEWKDSCCGCCTQQHRTCDNPPPNKCGKPCEGYDFRYKKSYCH